MAHCPKCNGVVGITTVKCPHCGYDWPESDLPSALPVGWENSEFAEIALGVAAITAGLGCFALVFAGISLAAREEWWGALFWCPIAFLNQFALLIVFLRVRRTK